jgi:hypothetical protein
VVDFSMALLSFADSAPRAYRLKAGNAYLTFSTSTGTAPGYQRPASYGRGAVDLSDNRTRQAQLTLV